VFVANKGLGNNERICKIRFRKVRRPELGDKGCSRCAQKGVIGMILPAEDMPYTKDGIIPDLIINSHAFPSRMTIAHLVECVFSKLCTLDGVIGDGTVFLPFDKDGMFERLGTHGFDKYGNEVMYNGRTGEMLHSEIFIGPTFYLRLKHMVTDKVHARGTGPKVMMTHQPTSGRSKFGGLRIGEMERDVVIGHGMSQFVKECMVEKADKYTWAVCKHCGTIAKYAPSKNIYECTGCKSNQLSVLTTPYSFKLLTQELEAMGIQMRLSNTAFADLVDQPESDVEEDQMEYEGGEFSMFNPTATGGEEGEGEEGGEGEDDEGGEDLDDDGGEDLDDDGGDDEGGEDLDDDGGDDVGDEEGMSEDTSAEIAEIADPQSKGEDIEDNVIEGELSEAESGGGINTEVIMEDPKPVEQQKEGGGDVRVLDINMSKRSGGRESESLDEEYDDYGESYESGDE
jgi:hypothetical protein